MLAQGSAQIAPIVCTSFNTTLAEPHPEDKGYRHAKIDLRLKLVGGKDSEHALGKPLTATPLVDELAEQTAIERQQEGIQQVTELAFS